MDGGATLRRSAVDAEHLQKRLRKVGRILAKVTLPADDVIDAERWRTEPMNKGNPAKFAGFPLDVISVGVILRQSGVMAAVLVERMVPEDLWEL
ncbi:hypothetical protein, partial [Streptomyces echinatus]|uniref:hypothetical protein n=1 Tax=Streptomyces echinatus TaxID=67293 RepID=UPI00382C8DDC